MSVRTGPAHPGMLGYDHILLLKNCFVKIEVSLIHDVVLIFALQQSDSVMHRDTHFFKIFFSNKDTYIENKYMDTKWGRRVWDELRD